LLNRRVCRSNLAYTTAFVHENELLRVEIELVKLGEGAASKFAGHMRTNKE